MYRRCLKRVLDFCIALLGIVILSPAFLVLYIMTWINLGRPVFFRQKRPGLNEHIFTLYKFRSMTDARDRSGRELPDEERLTSFGKFLRDSSLDELPELFNILKGDMAIVGPRPQLVRDMVFMTPEQRRRHTVRPGLTGLAQVNGRNAISWEQKLSYDLQYIQRITFSQDAIIFLHTFRKVAGQDDIHAEGMATAMDLGDDLLARNLITKEAYDRGQKEAARLLENS